MRSYFRELDANISGWFTPIVKWIIYLCVITFLIGFFLPAGSLFSWLGASPGTTILNFRAWQILTYAFVHADFPHLLFNLLSIWMFGTRLEQRWGTSTFGRFGLVVTAGAVATHMVALLTQNALGAPPAYLYIPIIGVSGLVYGIMLVYAMYWPNDPVYLYGLLPIKVKYLVAIMGIATLIATPRFGGGIAHLTHLGGLIFGFLFIKVPVLFDWVKIPNFRSRKRGPQFRQGNRWRDF